MSSRWQNAVCALLTIFGSISTFAAEPNITSDAPRYVTVGVPYQYLVVASDPDAAGPLTYSLQSPPTGMAVSSSGLVTWTAPHGYYDHVPVWLTVTDADDEHTSQLLDLIVEDPTNNEPVISSQLPESVSVGDTLDFSIGATDADNDTLLYTLYSSPPGVQFDRATGRILYTPDRSHVGTQYFLASATDNLGGWGWFDKHTEVVDPNNHAPEFGPFPATTINVGETFDYTIAATDADGDALNYLLYLKPDNTTFDPATGHIVWTPTRDDVGAQEFYWVARDNFGGEAHHDHYIEVVDPNNHAPEVQTLPPSTLNVGEALDYTIDAVDADGDPLHFSMYYQPDGAQFDAATGRIQWTPVRAQVGPQDFIWIIRDDFGGQTITNVTINVVDPNNHAPVISSTAPTQAHVDLPYQYQVQATDADDDEMSYRLYFGPSGMTIDGNGLVTWTPTAAQLGENNFKVAITDHFGGLVTQYVRLTAVSGSGPTDDDGDGVPNADDAFPADPDESVDTDNDGVGNNADTDDDNDGIEDVSDADSDGDGYSNAEEIAAGSDPDDASSVPDSIEENWPSDTAQLLPLIQSPTFRATSTTYEMVSGHETLPPQYYADWLGVIASTLPDAERSARRASIEASANTDAQRTPTGTVQVQGQRVTLQGDCSSSTQVFALASSSIPQSAVFETNCIPQNSQVIVNITGSILSLSQQQRFEALRPIAERVTFNIPQATRVNLSGVRLYGNLRAPFAVMSHPRGVVVGKVEAWQFHTPLTSIGNVANYAAPVTPKQSCQAPQRLSLAGPGSEQPNIAFDDGEVTWLTDAHATHASPTSGHTSHADYTEVNVNRSVYGIGVHGVYDGNGIPPPPDAITITQNPDHYWEKLLLVTQDSEGNPLSVRVASLTMPYAQPDAAAVKFYNDTDGSARSIGGEHYVGKSIVQLDDQNNEHVWLGSPGIAVNRGNHFKLSVAPGGEYTLREIGYLVNSAPGWITQSLPAANTGTAYQLSLRASDNDCDELQFAVTAGPAGLAVNASTGQLTWAMPVAGNHNVTLEVRDNNDATTSISLVLQVTSSGQVNHAPTITSVAVSGAIETQIYQYQVTADDIDGDVLTYALSQAPTGMTINSTSGAISWIPQYADSGSHDVTVQVADGNGGVASQQFSITVSNSNRAPVITSSVVTLASEGSVYTYQIEADDEDGDALSYTLIAAPNGMSINAQSGLVTWTAGFSAAGSYSVQVVVTDIYGAQDSQSFTLTVSNVNRAPLITSTPITAATQGVLYTYHVTASDQDNESLTYALAQFPSGMTIDTSSGDIEWTPGFFDVGTHTVIVEVTDAGGAGTQQTYSLTVVGVPNHAPGITSKPVLVAIAGKPYTYVVTTSDAEGDDVEIQLSQNPAGMTLNTSSNTISWANPVVGIYPVTVTATDSQGAEAHQQYQLQVVAEQPPVTTQGKEFWLMFNDNPSGNAGRLLYISSAVPANVTVSIESLGYTVTRAVNANSVITVDLSELVRTHVDDRGIASNAIHVVSDQLISTYLINMGTMSTDATLVIPEEALGNEYRLMSYAVKENDLASPRALNTGNYMGIVAIEDDTVIRIVPKAYINDTPTRVTYRIANEPYEIILDRGQTYQAIARSSGASGANPNDPSALLIDLTGTHISSSKPVAVFSGDGCAAVRDWYCDHLVEQLPPINSWASQYVTVPLATRKLGDTFRVLASQDQTYVVINDTITALLNAGEFYETLIDGSARIEGTKPILVAQFSNGALFDSGPRTTTSYLADPFMVLVPPVSQFLSAYNVTTPASKYRINYINLIADRNSVASIRLDGAAIPANNWTATPDSNLVSAQLPVTLGQYNIVGDEPFGAYIYGFDEYDSYGYLGGMALTEDKVVASMTLDVDDLSPSIGEHICATAQVFDDEETAAAQQQVLFRRLVAGHYQNYSTLTDMTGMAHYCYEVAVQGNETLEVRAQNISQNITLAWQAKNTGGNSAPQIISMPAMFATPGASYQYQVIAKDADLNPLQYSLVEKPTGMSIDPITGLVSWQATRNFVESWVTMRVSDGQLNATQRYRLSNTPGANHYPDFTSQPITRTMSGRAYKYVMVASDVDGDLLHYRLVSGPAGMSVSGANLIWMPGTNDVGIHTITVEVSDDDGYFSQQTFFLEVELNLPPQFTSTPVTSAIAGHTYSYNYLASDDNADNLSYRLVTAPAGMTIILAGKYVRWVPASNQVGDVPVVIEASDGFGGVSQQAFTVSVRANQPPVFTSVPPATVVAGHQYRYNYEVTDPDGDSLGYAKLLTGPTGMTVNTDAYWTPTAAQVGSHYIELQITDGFGASVTQYFTVTVIANQAPAFTSTPPATGTTGHNYRYAASATDPEGDFISYSVVSAPSGFGGSLHNFSWTPTAAQVGVFNIVLAASDNKGGVTQQTFPLTIAANRAPVFTSKPIYGGKVGVAYRDTLVATDPEGDNIFYRLVSGPSGMAVASSGTLSWVPSVAQVGVSSVTVEAYDAYNGVTQRQFDVTIANGTLEITHYPSNPVIVNDELYSFTVEAIHPTNLAVQFALTQAPSGMTINANSGLLQWTPTASQLGSHSVTLRAFDNQNREDSVSFTVQVNENTNQPPVISSQPPTTAAAGAAYNYAVQATDPEQQAISYSLPQAPAGMTISFAGVISWTPTAAQEGSRAVTVRATDDHGRYSEQSFTITVRANHAPQVTGTPFTSASVALDYHATIQGTDVDGDTLTYAVLSAPSGFSIGQQDGVVHWTPIASQAGAQPVSITISDGVLAIVVSWTINVSPDIVPLELGVVASPQVIQQDAQTLISVSIAGGVAQPTLQLQVDGAAVALNAQQQAVVTGTTIGRHEIAVTANDGAQTQTAYSWFSVADPLDTTPPVVELSSPVGGARITSPVDIVGTVQDAHLAEVKLLFRRTDSDTWIELYNGQAAFVEQAIAQFDPTQLVNGLYHIQLQAKDANGQQSAAAIAVVVDGDLKVGNFSFTVQDLMIPVSGIPVRVTRTYDSRRRAEALDFGYGWSVGYQDVRIEESSEPTEGWRQEHKMQTFTLEDAQVTLNATCTYPNLDKTVTVTLPDGDVERFTTHAQLIGGGHVSDTDPDCYMVGGRYYALRFQPEGDTQSTLETTDDASLYLTDVAGGNLSDVAETTPWPISHYRLITRAGFIYDLDQGFGVRKVTDPNGNTLTYSAAGIVHSSGLSVLFHRDSEGRIDSITDPKGQVVMTYHYNDADDLESVTDILTAQTRYTYNRSHGLLNIIDPLIRAVVKNIYDDDGRLIAQEDSAGNRREFDHDLEGRQSVVTDRNGNATVFYYDARGNVLSKVDALNGITQYTYDANDHQLTETNPLNFTKSATYNSKGDQLTQTDAENHTVTYAYNARGQETLVTDARGNTYEQTYDAFGNLETIEDPQGNIASNAILPNGLIESTTDLAGNTTQFTYYPSGNKQTETDALNNVTTYTYDGNNNRLTQTRSRTLANGTTVNETTTYTYDARNRLRTTTDPLGYVTSTEYDLVGNAIATVDAKNRRTETDYDAYGRVTEIRYPDGSSEGKTYDDEGNLLTETDRAGRTTVFEYDELNRLTDTTYPGGAHTHTEYDAAGRVVAETDARGHVTQFEYDDAGRRTAVIDALGRRHEMAYNASGNVETDTDALNHETTFTWNELDQKVATLFANGNTVSDGFDPMGRRTSHTDEAGVTTTYHYDVLGRLEHVVDVENNFTIYGYDEAGNKVSQRDVENRTTLWSYDALGRVKTRTLPLGQVESFDYDATGNEISHTDFNGHVTTKTYYPLNDRLHTVTYYDGTGEAYTYTASGQVETITQTDISGSRVTSNVYDVRDRLKQQTQPDGTVLGYNYDANGNRTQVSVTRNNTTYVTHYVYNALNQLTQVTDADGNITTYTYDAVGNRASETKANGNKVGYVYDERNRLTELTHRAVDNSVLQQFNYTLHPTGRRLQIDEASGRSTVYGYGYLYYLESETVTDAQNGNYSASYGYDGVGNRLEETINGVTTMSIVDANDRLTQKGGTTYTYDNNGNTLTETNGSDITLYAYNAKNELVSVTKGGAVTDFRYNASGIRTGKSTGSTSTNFVVDENRDYAQVLLETDGSDTVRYTYGDDLISQTVGGVERYFHYDGLGSTRALSDEAGAISDTYDYGAFGEELNQDGSTENHYRFTGEQFDSDLNQYYLRARYYDQSIGRFASQDSWQGNNQEPVTLHKYAYANLDPVNGTDPSGHMFLGELGAASRINAIFATMATPSYSSAIFRVGAGLIAGGLAYGLSQEYKEFISRNAPVMDRILEEKREKEEARVGDISNGRHVLYHYTDRAAALEIATFGVGISSPGYGSGRPPGFYASSISPWDPNYSQEDLSALFYGGSRSRDVSWFVAIDGQSFVKYPYNEHEWYSPSSTGEVNLEVITVGPNLMLPK